MFEIGQTIFDDEIFKLKFEYNEKTIYALFDGKRNEYYFNAEKDLSLDDEYHELIFKNKFRLFGELESFLLRLVYETKNQMSIKINSTKKKMFLKYLSFKFKRLMRSNAFFEAKFDDLLQPNMNLIQEDFFSFI